MPSHFCGLQNVQTRPDARPLSYSVGAGNMSLGIKRPGRAADAPVSGGEVKMCGAVPLRHHAHSENFTFYHVTFFPSARDRTVQEL